MDCKSVAGNDADPDLIGQTHLAGNETKGEHGVTDKKNQNYLIQET